MNESIPSAGKTKLENHYSIISIAFKHSVSLENYETWYKQASLLHWQVHDFLKGAGPRSGIPEENQKEEGVMPFLPHLIFTPNSQEMTFGFCGTAPEHLLDEDIIERRLSPNKNILNKKGKKFVENFILSLKPSSENLLHKDLSFSLTNKISIKFQIDWVDAWFFNDETGVLSFKVNITSVLDSGVTRKANVDDLNALNRNIRFTGDLGISISVSDIADSKISFWKEIVYQNWLGVNDSNSTNLFGSTVPFLEFHETHVDRFTRYAKVQVLAEIHSLEEGRSEFVWNSPVIDPPLDFNKYYDEIYSGKHHEIFSAYHFATMEGYPTNGDYLLYDLATCGGEGEAGGFTGNRRWMVSPEYLRTVLSNSSIEIWEYWRGLALHDTLAFLSYDESMPINWQAEAYYYPLYVYHYHLQFRLNCFSENIIDQELNNVLKARQIKDEFNRFRNQYWFQDLTVEFQGLELSERIKNGLGINGIYETIEAEISDISEFIDMKIERGKQSFFAFVLLAFYPVTYIWDVSGMSDILIGFGKKNPEMSTITMIGVLIALAGISAFFVPKLTDLTSRLYSKIYRTRM